MLRAAVLQWDLSWLIQRMVTNIALLGLITVADVVLLSAAVTVPFHCCGGNTEMWAKLGRQYAGR